MYGLALRDDLRIVPANESTWRDICTVFGERGYPAACMCQKDKLPASEWWPMPREERAHLLRVSTECEVPDAEHTSGLVAYLGAEPVGWVAVEPRTEYQRLLKTRVTWAGRHEDKTDDKIWSIVCFVVRAGYRRQGLTYALAKAAVAHAFARGAEAVEAYPMITTPGEEITWGEDRVGSHHVFEAAGMAVASRPSKRRLVLRIDSSDAVGSVPLGVQR